MVFEAIQGAVGNIMGLKTVLESSRIAHEAYKCTIVDHGSLELTFMSYFTAGVFGPTADQMFSDSDIDLYAHEMRCADSK